MFQIITRQKFLCLFIAVCFLTVCCAPQLSAVPLPKKAQKQISKLVSEEILKPAAQKLLDLRAQYETIRREDKSLVERYGNELNSKERDTRNVFNDSIESLDVANSDFTQALSNEMAIDYIEPYQAALLFLADNFREQVGIVQGPATIDGAIQNTRNVIGVGVRELEDDFKNLRSLNSHLSDFIRNREIELLNISNGASDREMPYGKQIYIEKTLQDFQFMLSAISSLPSYIHNRDLDGNFAPAVKVATTDVILSLENLLEDISSIAQTATTFSQFNNTVSDTILVDYLGSSSQIGHLTHWQNALNALQNNINFLEDEVRNAQNNGQEELAKNLSLQVYQFERERNYVYIQRQFAILPHSNILREARSIAGILSNESQNGVGAWRKAPDVIRENLSTVNSEHQKMYLMFSDLMRFAQSEFASFSSFTSSEEEQRALAGRISNKLKAIRTGGGIDTANEQLTSTISAMSLLASSISQGNISSELAISTWVFSIDTKHEQYQFDRHNTIPAILRDAQIRQRRYEGLVFDSLNRLNDIEAVKNAYPAQRELYLARYSKIDTFHRENREQEILDTLAVRLSDIVGQSRFTKRKKLRKLLKKFLSKSDAVGKATQLRSQKNSQKRNSRKRLHKSTKRFVSNFLTSYTSNLNTEIDEAADQIAQLKIIEKTDELRALARSITSFE